MTASKKRTLILVLLISAVTMTVLIASLMKANETPQIPDKPEDAVLEFWITENVEGVNWDKYKEVHPLYGAKEYFGKGYERALQDNGEKQSPYVSYLITAYPDYVDGGEYVTEIEITDPTVTVYGLTINSPFEEFDSLFQGKGYEIHITENRYWQEHQAVKNGITFSLKTGIFNVEDREEKVFTISAVVSNREGICF